MSFRQVAMKGLHLCKAHAPEIMIGASIVAGAAALYFTVRGTMKLDQIIDEHNDEMEGLKEHHDSIPETEEAEKEYKKQVALQYVKTSGKIALAYAPAAGLALASAGLNVAAHGMMRKRVATALAAVESVSGAFAAYRQRVKDKFGEDADYEIMTGKKVERVEETVVDAKGKTKTVKKDEVTISDIITSPYARYFSAKTSDEFYCSMSNDGSGAVYNEEFLKSAEQTFDLQLRLNGYVFLNDVYRRLGFEETPEGQLTGWRLNGDGDGCIKFSIEKVFNGDNENDDVWFLDFNVDGIIFDKI